jgi:hypothetical protein
MKEQKQKQKSAVDAMKQTKGRFFGLYLKSGESINAQFRRETPEKVVIYDRNNSRDRIINKSSINLVYTNSTNYVG